MTHTQEDVQCLSLLLPALVWRLAGKDRSSPPASDLLTCSPPVITAGGTAVPAVEKFCYLGRKLSADASSRTVKASQSFGMWNDHGILLERKVAVYKAAILTILRYGILRYKLSYNIINLIKFSLNMSLKVTGKVVNIPKCVNLRNRVG